MTLKLTPVRWNGYFRSFFSFLHWWLPWGSTGTASQAPPPPSSASSTCQWGWSWQSCRSQTTAWWRRHHDRNSLSPYRPGHSSTNLSSNLKHVNIKTIFSCNSVSESVTKNLSVTLFYIIVMTFSLEASEYRNILHGLVLKPWTIFANIGHSSLVTKSIH